MDPFVAANAELAAQRGNATSWYDLVVPALTEAEREALDAALGNPQITNRAIALVLERWGHQVKEGTIGAWRRRCGRR